MSNTLESLNCIFSLEVDCLNNSFYSFFLCHFVLSFSIFSPFNKMTSLILFKVRNDALPYNKYSLDLHLCVLSKVWGQDGQEGFILVILNNWARLFILLAVQLWSMGGTVSEKCVLELGETGFCGPLWGPWEQAWVGVVCLGSGLRWGDFCWVSK